MRSAPMLGWAALLAAVPAPAPDRPRPRPRCDLSTASVPRGDPACARRWFDANLRVNDLLVVGTHNSYKRAIPPAELAAVARAAPAVAATLDYSHRSLAAELDAGARQLEIDPYYDPAGGRYLHPRGPAAAGADLGAAWRAAMARPGFKVFHVVDLDVRSSCVTFRDCLVQVRRWSDAHPGHVPITLLINAKDEHEVPDGVAPLPFERAAFDALEAEIRSVLPPSRLVTPDRVRGRYPTLRDGARANNWPTLGEARGKFLLVLEAEPVKVRAYTGDRPSLQGRLMFVNAPDEALPSAAYITLNEPVAEAARIRRDVSAGLLVRTRADADTAEARANDPRRREAALGGGAQLVSTDYLWLDPRFAGGYRVGLAGGAAALCDPVRTGDRCAGLPVER